MALLFPVVILAIFAVLFAQHRGRDARARRYLDRVEAELIAGAAPAQDHVQGHVDAAAGPRLPHHLQHVIAAAHANPDETATARALAAIAEYRDFRGWRKR